MEKEYDCPLNTEFCDYGNLSLRHFEEYYAKPSDSAKKVMGKWASQLRECQKCPELKRNNS